MLDKPEKWVVVVVVLVVVSVVGAVIGVFVVVFCDNLSVGSFGGSSIQRKNIFSETSAFASKFIGIVYFHYRFHSKLSLPRNHSP